MAGGGSGSPVGQRRSPRQNSSPGGARTSPAQFRAMQEQIGELPTVAKSGMHAYRIPRAVRADVCVVRQAHAEELTR